MNTCGRLDNIVSMSTIKGTGVSLQDALVKVILKMADLFAFMYLRKCQRHVLPRFLMSQ